jgi:hypothetical protein
MEQCVEHTNAVTPPQELSDDDRADVSGAAGNKNKSHHIHRYYFGVDTNLGSFQQPSQGECSSAPLLRRPAGQRAARAPADLLVGNPQEATRRCRAAAADGCGARRAVNPRLINAFKVPEAKLKKTEYGLVPNGDGWYVIKVRDVVGFTVDEVAKRNGASFADITG